MYIILFQLQSVSFDKIHVSSLNKVSLDRCADIRKVDKKDKSENCITSAYSEL